MDSTNYLARLAPATAEKVVREYLVELISGKANPSAHPGVADLRALPFDQKTLDALAAGISSKGAGFNSQLPALTRQLMENVVEPALQVVPTSFPEPQHRGFTTTIPARDFKTQRFVLSMDPISVDEISENSEYTHHAAEGQPESVSLKTYGKVFSITRQTITNDASCRYFADVGNALVAGAYRKEAELVYGLMESNPDLADSAPWFDATNSLTKTGWNRLGALQDGFELFYNQTTASGGFVGAVPRYVVLPPDWRFSVTDLFSDMLLQPPTVIISPWVTSAYLVAGDTCPSVGLVGLGGNLTPSLAVNGKMKLEDDLGLQVKVTHDVAVIPVSRCGIVRMTVTE